MKPFRNWIDGALDRLDHAYRVDVEGMWSGFLAASISSEASNRAAKLGLTELVRVWPPLLTVLDAKRFLATCLAACPAVQFDFTGRFLPIDAAAVYSGISVESVRRLLSSGKLTALRPVKGRIVIDRIQLDSVVLSSNSRPRKGRGLKR